MSEHDEHSSFIKTPQQLIVVVLLAFLVPVIGIVLLVGFVVDRPSSDPKTLAPEAVAQRIQPAGRIQFADDPEYKKRMAAAPAAAAAPAPAAQPAAAAGPADGKAVYGKACVACHVAGVANAPKLGDKAAWAPRIGTGIDALVKSVIGGKGAMPPKAGNPSLTDAEIRAAVEYMVGESK
ncbi:MAG TPA: c-type cytochrome [Burkholderiales bacterium]|nr:c-type cytochrome [Burkholderiales bacterium]